MFQSFAEETVNLISKQMSILLKSLLNQAKLALRFIFFLSKQNNCYCNNFFLRHIPWLCIFFLIAFLSGDFFYLNCFFFLFASYILHISVTWYHSSRCQLSSLFFMFWPVFQKHWTLVEITNAWWMIPLPCTDCLFGLA